MAFARQHGQIPRLEQNKGDIATAFVLPVDSVVPVVAQPDSTAATGNVPLTT